ncbi:hypothetical protein HAX54_029483 [Datura stramonium]|uniref:Ribosomal protein S3 n=1 Tax=Datura stramonium TaxID=4076 RepID=A0ABS8V9C1_DATST|nr:hypothetical protein [Datura stramonium]
MIPTQDMILNLSLAERSAQCLMSTQNLTSTLISKRDLRPDLELGPDLDHKVGRVEVKVGSRVLRSRVRSRVSNLGRELDPDPKSQIGVEVQSRVGILIESRVLGQGKAASIGSKLGVKFWVEIGSWVPGQGRESGLE